MLYACFAALAAALLGLDQWFKAWVTANLPLGETMAFIPGLMQIRTVHNYGAAWSSFSGMRYLLIFVTSAIVFAVALAVVLRIVRHPLGLLAASLIISGGLGNIIDRARFGYVVDMFDLTFINYPVFNIADICIVCGCFLGCAYYLWFYEKYDKKVKQTDGEADAEDNGN
ncbi:MAG: signal peptidase II [Oscillibacter sp.]|nr:signal peptidase II [Oscillibacter sp.]